MFLYFFFFFLLLPPRSTLFPYTTLFRSIDLGTGHLVDFLGGVLGSELSGEYARCNVFLLPSRKEGFASSFSKPWRTPDRKSTRLNSSHGSISYAVFCLKKKNKIDTRYD